MWVVEESVIVLSSLWRQWVFSPNSSLLKWQLVFPMFLCATCFSYAVMLGVCNLLNSPRGTHGRTIIRFWIVLKLLVLPKLVANFCSFSDFLDHVVHVLLCTLLLNGKLLLLLSRAHPSIYLRQECVCTCVKDKCRIRIVLRAVDQTSQSMSETMRFILWPQTLLALHFQSLNVRHVKWLLLCMKWVLNIWQLIPYHRISTRWRTVGIVVLLDNLNEGRNPNESLKNSLESVLMQFFSSSQWDFVIKFPCDPWVIESSLCIIPLDLGSPTYSTNEILCETKVINWWIKLTPIHMLGISTFLVQL